MKTDSRTLVPIYTSARPSPPPQKATCSRRKFRTSSLETVIDAHVAHRMRLALTCLKSMTAAVRRPTAADDKRAPHPVGFSDAHHGTPTCIAFGAAFAAMLRRNKLSIYSARSDTIEATHAQYDSGPQRSTIGCPFFKEASAIFRLSRHHSRSAGCRR